MENRVLNNEELKEIIDRLFDTIGVRMSLRLDDCPFEIDHRAVSQSAFTDAAKVITDHMELPVSIRPIFSSMFRTQGMVLNESNSTSGIGAQVSIPEYLPWHKSDAMVNYPISVTVPPEALAKGYYYLMTQLSHEFSHIYLYSRRDPQKTDEWATDLCALMMGFAPLWLEGRKITRTEVNPHTYQRQTVVHTQGYLSDAGFKYAVGYTDSLRAPFLLLRKDISRLIQSVQTDCDELSHYLVEISLLHGFHRKNVQTAFRDAADAAIFCEVAQEQYKSETERLLTVSKQQTNRIVRAMQGKREFFARDREWLQNTVGELRSVVDRLDRRLEKLRNDHYVISRNIDSEHYEKIFDERIKAVSDCVDKAESRIAELERQSETLGKCLVLHEDFGKETYAQESDAGVFSLIRNSEYKEYSRRYMAESREKLADAKRLLDSNARYYTIDDADLVAEISALDSLISGLNHGIAEQKGYVATVVRNLMFAGKLKWYWARLSGNL